MSTTMPVLADLINPQVFREVARVAGLPDGMPLHEWARDFFDLLMAHYDVDLDGLDDRLIDAFVARLLVLAAEGRADLFRRRGSSMDMDEWRASEEADRVMDAAADQAVMELCAMLEARES